MELNKEKEEASKSSLGRLLLDKQEEERDVEELNVDIVVVRLVVVAIVDAEVGIKGDEKDLGSFNNELSSDCGDDAKNVGEKGIDGNDDDDAVVVVVSSGL